MCKTRTSKINHLDGTLFVIFQQDILRFQITMNHTHILSTQKGERSKQLLCKLANQIQRNTLKLGILEQVIQIVWQQLKYKAQVLSPSEKIFQLN